MPIALTSASIFKSFGGCEEFLYGEGLQASPQPARSATEKDTGISEERHLAAQRKD